MVRVRDAILKSAAHGALAATKEATMSKKSTPSRNDQRSNVKNPTNAAYPADRQNRIQQGHAPPAPAPPAPTNAPRPRD
jgi:hypothetical protein